MHVYLISIDNGESYEDHHITPVCVVPTKRTADRLTEEWREWADKKHAEMPGEFVAPEDEAAYEAAYDVYAAKMGAFREAIKPPHGFDELTALVDWEYTSPYLTIRKVGYINEL